MMAGVATGSAHRRVAGGIDRLPAGHAQLAGIRWRSRIGPLDTFNGILINSMVFAFVPMLTAGAGADRVALFSQTESRFRRSLSGITVLVLIAAAPVDDARVSAGSRRTAISGTPWRSCASSRFSTIFVGMASVSSGAALTDRRFVSHSVLSGRSQRLHHRLRAGTLEDAGGLRLCRGVHHGRIGRAKSSSFISPRAGSAPGAQAGCL